MAKFQKGAPSPNPSGRPRGTKSAPNLLRDGLVGIEDLRSVVAIIVQKAKDGDLAAATVLLDRTIPRLKPAADVADEVELAEATTAAKVRGARSEGGGLTLEQLVVCSVERRIDVPDSLSPTTQPTVPATTSQESSPMCGQAAAVPPPVPPLHIPVPPSEDDGYPFDDVFNPT